MFLGSKSSFFVRENTLCFDTVYCHNRMRTNQRLYLKAVSYTRFSFSGFKYISPMYLCNNIYGGYLSRELFSGKNIHMKRKNHSLPHASISIGNLTAGDASSAPLLTNPMIALLNLSIPQFSCQYKEDNDRMYLVWFSWKWTELLHVNNVYAENNIQHTVNPY